MKKTIQRSILTIFAALLAAGSLSVPALAAETPIPISAPLETAAPATHTIMAGAASNGTISPAGAVSVADGSSKTFTITPNSGYEINEVIVDGSRKGNLDSYTFQNIGLNHTIVASFKKQGESSYSTNLLKTDTRSYQMAPGNVYGVKIQVEGSKFNQSDVKVYSSRDHIASVTKVTDTVYQIKGLAPGTAYIVAEIGNTHASVRVDVANGVKQGGEACRSVSIIEGVSVSQPPSENSTLEKEQKAVFDLVNQNRTGQKLPALEYRSDLQKAADVRAKEIVTKFSHTRPNGSSCFTAVMENGVTTYRALGENIAAGQKDAAAVMKAWMNSPGHRANILSSQYTGIAVGVYEQNGMKYWVQFFIR